MEVEKLIKTWLFSYSCQQKYTSVLHVLSGEFSDDPSPPALLHLRLAISNLHTIVLQRMDDHAYHDAVAITTDLFEQFQHVVTYREYAKVVTGLKTLALFHVLKENQKLALPRLNLYYPRTGLQHKALDKKLSARLNKVQHDFRKFFLSLIANKKSRDKYFAKEYTEEFGMDFQTRLQRLTSDFLAKLEAKLPQTEVQKLLSCGADGQLSHQLSSLHHPYVELFLDVLYASGAGTLSQAAVLDFLASLHKLKTGDVSRGIVGRMMHLDSQCDSDSSQASMTHTSKQQKSTSTPHSHPPDATNPSPNIWSRSFVGETSTGKAKTEENKTSTGIFKRQSSSGNRSTANLSTNKDTNSLTERDTNARIKIAKNTGVQLSETTVNSTTKTVVKSPTTEACITPRTKKSDSKSLCILKHKQSDWLDAPAAKKSRSSDEEALEIVPVKSPVNKKVVEIIKSPATKSKSSDVQIATLRNSAKKSKASDDEIVEVGALNISTTKAQSSEEGKNQNRSETKSHSLVEESREVVAVSGSSSDEVENLSSERQIELSQGFLLSNDVSTPTTSNTERLPLTFGAGRVYKMKRVGGITETPVSKEQIEVSANHVAEFHSPSEKSVIVISSGSNSKGSSEESTSLLAGAKRVLGLSGVGDAEDSSSLMPRSKTGDTTSRPHGHQTPSPYQQQFVHFIGEKGEGEEQEQVAIVSSSSSSNTQSQEHAQKKRSLSGTDNNMLPYPDSPSSKVVLPSESDDSDSEVQPLPSLSSHVVHKVSPLAKRLRKDWNKDSKTAATKGKGSPTESSSPSKKTKRLKAILRVCHQC